jgi:hypothetical protein
MADRDAGANLDSVPVLRPALGHTRPGLRDAAGDINAQANTNAIAVLWPRA